MNPTTAAALIGASSAIAGGLVVSLLNLWNAKAQRKFDADQRERDRRAKTASELRDNRINAHLALLSSLDAQSRLTFEQLLEQGRPVELAEELMTVRLLSSPEVGDLAQTAVITTRRLYWIAEEWSEADEYVADRALEEASNAALAATRAYRRAAHADINGLPSS